jgi:GNAT superfamily N-acetyltransferase
MVWWVYADKTGVPFSLRLCGGAEFDALVPLYEAYEPKERAQGLPPGRPEQRARWLGALRDSAINVVAVTEEGAVGHAGLIPIEPGGRCEYMIFVHQDHRNRGIGTALTRLACRVAREAGYRSLWLTVAATNVPAIRVYDKVGFRMVGPPESEREMMLDLTAFPPGGAERIFPPLPARSAADPASPSPPPSGGGGKPSGR